jgi:hypothetical protein
MKSDKTLTSRLNRKFRLEVMRLEDRLVPGEVFGTAMLWALGSFTYPALLSQESFQEGQGAPDASNPAQARDWTNPDLSDQKLASLTICRIDDPTTDTAGGGAATPAPATAQSQVPATSTDAGNQSTAGSLPSFNVDSMLDPFANAFEASPAESGGGGGGAVLSGGQGSSSAAGGAAGATMPGGPAAPLLATSSGFTQSQQLFNAAGFFSGGSMGGESLGTAGQAAPAQAQAAAQASTGGGDAAPLLIAHHVAAPTAQALTHVKPLAAGGAAPYSPSQLATAYGFNKVSNQGSGQTIYIVDAYNDPNISKDLTTFDTQWGLPNPSFTVHKMGSRIRNSVSWGIEESLDVEWAHAMAPQANVVLVEATSASYSALFAAVDWATSNGAHIVSMSWGGGDASSDSSYDSHFNHSGVTYIASSGDTGGVVEYPSASPYVLSAGGTSLTLNSDNTYNSESAWSSGGGGASANESEPGYQTGFNISLSGRGTPDVSYDADPNTGVYVYDSYYYGGGGWFEVGGTSAAAPQWASIVALADHGRATPLSTNNTTSRTEYNAAVGALYASNYHDITTGSNGYAAGTGYDLATGIGSPQVNNLVPWLVGNS